jgi:hypothetical protein
MRTFYCEYFPALPGAFWSTTCKLVGAEAGRRHLRNVTSELVGAEAGRHHQLVDLPEAVGAVRLGEAVGVRATGLAKVTQDPWGVPFQPYLQQTPLNRKTGISGRWHGLGQPAFLL